MDCGKLGNLEAGAAPQHVGAGVILVRPWASEYGIGLPLAPPWARVQGQSSTASGQQELVDDHVGGQ